MCIRDRLRAGRMGGGGKAYTASQINSMMYTTMWKNRYDHYLKKIIYPGNVIAQNLNRWFDKWNKCLCPKSGYLFTKKIEATTVKDQCKKAPYLEDVVPVEDMYNK